MSWHALWLLGLAGCAGDVVEGSEPPGPGAVPVETWTAERAVLARSATWTGVVRGRQQATVLTETGGRITHLVAQVGDTVAAGATLVRLEDGRQSTGVQAAQATLARAVAAEQAAERQLARAELLGDAVPRVDLEDAGTAAAVAAADRQAAQVQLAARERDLADTRVQAPFAGDLTRQHVDLGQVVGVGTPVATVVDTSELRVRIGVSTRDLAQLTSDAAAHVAGQDCRVDRVDRQVDPATGLVQLEVACPPDRSLVVGSPVVVQLALGDGVPVLSLPADAVLDRYGETVIYVVEDGVAVARSVRLGLRTDTHRQVLGGVEVGEVVVVRGAQRLVDGAQVEVR